MSELENLLKDIDNLRSMLYELISDKNANIQDSEIVAASQVLNVAITKYTEILTKKSDKE